MFYLGGVSLAFFLFILLVSKKNKIRADYVLTGWLLVITFHLLLFYLAKSNQYPELLGWGITLPLLHGPFLYWYTRALTNRSISVFHFIIPIAFFSYTIPFLLLPAQQKLYVFQNHGAGYETFNILSSVAIAVSGVLYVTLANIVLLRHRKSIMQEFSATEKINLQWLQYLIYWIGAIWVFVILGNDDLVFAAAVLFVVFIGFFGIRQAGIFHSKEGEPAINSKPMVLVNRNDVVQEEEILNKRKYQKSGLSNESSEALHRQLWHVMEVEKVFRESELSLADLAVKLNTQPNYLSQVINEREGKNFYDFINTLRIEEFKKVVANPENQKFTLLALAQECGFNSKSSFNRYFKKVSGQSPSEYLDAIARLPK